MFKVTTLLENSTVRHNLLSQHGQSLLIEVNGKRVLFDVGEIYEGFMYNLQRFKLSINDIDIIAISHRHIDHIGSLEKILPTLTDQELYLPSQLGEPDKRAKSPKYVFTSDVDQEEYNVAVEPELANKYKNYEHTINVGNDPLEILPNFYSTGCIGEKMQEQALVYDQKEKGIIILVGCSHPSLLNLINKAVEVTGNSKVRAVVGGFHYNKMTKEEVEERANELKNLGVELIYPNHCTGHLQANYLKEFLGDRIVYSQTTSVGTGNSICFDDEIKTDFA